jgi:DNA repair exonuclease SbcCD ATPase subunit
MSEEDGMSTEDLFREKEQKIAALQSQKESQDEQILLLREEIGSNDIKHREEIYWMRLEVDNLRREKEALEDRVQQVYRDIREEEVIPDVEEAPNGYDATYVMDLQAQVGKYIRTLGILDHQIVMVKSSCDEVVKSLKEEIGDVMEEKCRMEMDLLNQLAVLDSEKRELEIAYDQQMKFKNDQISELKQTVSNAKDPSVVSSDTGKDKEEELLNEINDLKELKKTLEDDLEAERADADDAIARLEDANADLEQTIEALNGDLEVMREGAATAEAIEVLDALARDRQETLTSLERVAMIWEKADDSVHSLEDIMDDLRKDETNEQGDCERLLSTLETASLVHGQIKVSLLLIELKLRNQLSSLKNDKLRMGQSDTSADKDANVTEQMREIQKEALSVLDLVEKSLTNQMKQIEEAERDETEKMKDTLQEKTEELKNLQAQHRALESEIGKLRLKKEEEKKQSTDEKPGENGNAEVAVSKAVLERLQAEVLTVVERVKDKNDTIGKLKTLIEEHKVREGALKKELRRIMKRSSRPSEGQNAGNGGSGNGQRQARRNTVVKTKL